MRATIISAFVLLCMAFGSCSANRDVATLHYYAGEVSHDTLGNYFLQDCATGRRMDISTGAGLVDLGAEYDALARFPYQRIFAEFEGQIVQWNDTMPQVKVDRLICFDAQMSCINSYYVVGLYGVASGHGNGTLELRDDYTYLRTELRGEPFAVHHISQGEWHLSAALELVLVQAEPTKARYDFQLVPPQFSLVRNDGGEPLVFTKQQ